MAQLQRPRLNRVNVRVTLRARGGAVPPGVGALRPARTVADVVTPGPPRGTGGARLSAELEGLVHGPAGLAARFTAEAAMDEDAWTWGWQVAPRASAAWSPCPSPSPWITSSAPDPADQNYQLTIARSPLAAPLVAGYAPVAQLALQRLLRP